MNRILIPLLTLTLCTFAYAHPDKNAGKVPVDELIRSKVEQIDLGSQVIQGQQVLATSDVPLFYARRGFDPAWTNQHTRQLAVYTLQRAYEEGLNPIDYHITAIEKLLALPGPSNAELADLDILLSDGVLMYASHLLNGKVNPVTIDAEWNISLRKGDPVKAIENGLRTNQLEKAIGFLAPRQRQYIQLKELLKEYRSLLVRAGEWPILPEGPSLKPGESDIRVPILRARLSHMEEFQPDSAILGLLFYDSSLVDATMKFQTRHGLNPDGVVGNSTREALNVSLTERIDQIRVNLERWRWIPKENLPYYLLVNIANYEVQGFRNGKLEVTHKVIVGKPFRKTPVFSATMRYLVVNPTWTVPKTIRDEDVIPGMRKNLGYLASKGLNVYDTKGKKLDHATLDWSDPVVKTYTYRQEPGPTNALGLIKFMFPNKHDVYMHDTPSKELFEKEERTFSSGCIRVSRPFELAQWLMQDSTEWNRPKFDEILATKEPKTIVLPEQPEVYVMYFTTWVDAEGKAHFRKDIYSRDTPILNGLNTNEPKTN